MRNVILALASLTALIPAQSFAQVFGGYSRGTSTYQAQGPSYSQSPQSGYQFRLNGKVIMTDRQLLSGPSGCQSDLVDRTNGQPICPFDNTNISPQTVWEATIARKCPINRYGESLCIGGIVAVGQNCMKPSSYCSYYRIVPTYKQTQQWEVNVHRIGQLGREVWIESSGSLYRHFLFCHGEQYKSYRQNC